MVQGAWNRVLCRQQEETTENKQHFSRKLKVDIFIDDRNLGGLPDWGTIYRMVSRRKTWNDIFEEDSALDFHSSYERHHNREKKKKKWWQLG